MSFDLKLGGRVADEVFDSEPFMPVECVIIQIVGEIFTRIFITGLITHILEAIGLN